FVRLRGEDGQGEASDKKNFINKTVGQRFLIIVAGVVMNFLLAAIIFVIGLSIGWPQATDNLHRGAIVTGQQVIAIEVVKDSPAEKAGVKAGDAITHVANQTITSINQLRGLNNESKGQSVSYQITRDGQEINLKISPEILADQPDQYGVGVALAESGMVSYKWPQALWEGFSLAAVGIKDIAVGFWQLLANLFQGQDVSDQVSGPVGIAILTGQVSHLGWLYLLQFIALLSLNLAFINILPLPALDGGRLLFIVCEKIAGRPVKANIEAIVHSIGFILLLVFIAFITLKDIIRLF
nr:RIP metalloprotease RseP [bacterium]